MHSTFQKGNMISKVPEKRLLSSSICPGTCSRSFSTAAWQMGHGQLAGARELLPAATTNVGPSTLPKARNGLRCGAAALRAGAVRGTGRAVCCAEDTSAGSGRSGAASESLLSAGGQVSAGRNLGERGGCWPNEKRATLQATVLRM